MVETQPLVGLVTEAVYVPDSVAVTLAPLPLMLPSDVLHATVAAGLDRDAASRGNVGPSQVKYPTSGKTPVYVAVSRAMSKLVCASHKPSW